MDISAKITGIKYTPFLCRDLEIFDIRDLRHALSKKSVFVLNSNKKHFAISWWVSAKRTRSYPYTRVYDSLGFSGKKVTIIPVMKDEGKRGDRDFLQWDTISLMSLLGVYVIIAYYKNAKKSSRYKNKITNQRFDICHIKQEIQKLFSYQSDALHWNLSQIENIGNIGKKAIKSYRKISQDLSIEMHSETLAKKRIEEILKGKDDFMNLSRELAKEAQKRETITIQPKENLSGKKGAITIKNYLGGYYYFTVDEVRIKRNKIYLIEAKHSKINHLPSLEDIKDGLLKMILFSNLQEIKIGSKQFLLTPILKLTSSEGFKIEKLNEKQKKIFNLLQKEATENNFSLEIS